MCMCVCLFLWVCLCVCGCLCVCMYVHEQAICLDEYDRPLTTLSMPTFISLRLFCGIDGRKLKPQKQASNTDIAEHSLHIA